MEQFFQCNKAVHAHKPDIAKTILSCDSPLACKRHRDSLKCDSNEWLPEAKKVDLDGCRAKFAQDLYAKNILLATDDKTLIEAGPDKTWGVGMYMTDKDIAIPEKWKGTNLLGEILMKVRDELK